MTQKQFAELVGITSVHFSSLANGKTVAGKKLAKSLQFFTGIPEDVWRDHSQIPKEHPRWPGFKADLREI